MRVSGPSRPVGPQVGGGARRAGGGGTAFQPEGGGPVGKAPATLGGPVGVSGLEALMALQSVDADGGGGGKRRRAVRRAHDLLDVLEEMKIGLLSGGLPLESLDRISALVGQLEATGDERLDGLLEEIGLRAEVELAKRGRYVTRPMG